MCCSLDGKFLLAIVRYALWNGSEGIAILAEHVHTTKTADSQMNETTRFLIPASEIKILEYFVDALFYLSPIIFRGMSKMLPSYIYLILHRD